MAKKPENTELEELTIQDDVNSETQEVEETTSSVVEGGEVINPIAYAVTLREIHPQPSYGRCGYSFNKESAVEIPAGDLTGEQVIILAEDPWLELVPVCEE